MRFAFHTEAETPTFRPALSPGETKLHQDISKYWVGMHDGGKVLPGLGRAAESGRGDVLIWRGGINWQGGIDWWVGIDWRSGGCGELGGWVGLCTRGMVRTLWRLRMFICGTP